jgi:hypothetical protein
MKQTTFERKLLLSNKINLLSKKVSSTINDLSLHPSYTESIIDPIIDDYIQDIAIDITETIIKYRNYIDETKYLKKTYSRYENMSFDEIVNIIKEDIDYIIFDTDFCRTSKENDFKLEFSDGLSYDVTLFNMFSFMFGRLNEVNHDTFDNENMNFDTILKNEDKRQDLLSEEKSKKSKEMLEQLKNIF